MKRGTKLLAAHHHITTSEVNITGPAASADRHTLSDSLQYPTLMRKCGGRCGSFLHFDSDRGVISHISRTENLTCNQFHQQINTSRSDRERTANGQRIASHRMARTKCSLTQKVIRNVGSILIAGFTRRNDHSTANALFLVCLRAAFGATAARTFRRRTFGFRASERWRGCNRHPNYKLFSIKVSDHPSSTKYKGKADRNLQKVAADVTGHQFDHTV